MSNVLNLVGLLDMSLSEHTINIIVADDLDQILDSGVCLAALSAGDDTNGGITPSQVPLPTGLPLLLAGLGAFAAVRRSKKT